MKFETLQTNSLETELESKSEKVERPGEPQTAETSDFNLSQEVAQAKIEDAQEIQKVRQEIAAVPKVETLPTAQKEDIEVTEQKPSWLASKLDTAKRYLKVATLGAGVFMGANKLEAGNPNQGTRDKLTDKTEQARSVENKNEKSIDGGNLAEIVVYGKKKYEEELLKQTADMKKYEADLGKYKKDSTEWIKANEFYQDSLMLHNLTNKIYQAANEVENSYKEIALLKTIPDDKLNKYKQALKILEENEEKYFYKSRYNNVTQNQPVKDRFVDINPHSVWDAILDRNAPLRGSDAYAPEYKKPTNKPIQPQRPESPKTEKIKYDPKYEDLNMRPLWATMVKNNPNEKIGTLKLLDPRFESGFTLEEAMSFPQEIKDKYNIDYIYKQVNGKQ
jgi:hypothetical protein